MPCKTYATLLNGAKMPLLGYGTWQAAPGELEGPLQTALEAGYRHIDTAAAYGNEDVIGKVLRDNWLAPGKLKREDLFIVTKLPSAGVRPGGARKWLQRSLDKLGLDYVDMYLVHVPMAGVELDDSPFPMGPDNKMKFEKKADHITVWKEMEAELKAGNTKAIGLSNFNKRQIQNVLDHCTIKPSNLQVELHVYMQQRPLVNFCHENGIVVTAYSSLGTPGSAAFFKVMGKTEPIPDLIKNPVVLELAKTYNKSPGQILLKQIVQRGIVTIPKSLNKERIQQNIALFNWELSPADMSRLEALDLGKDGRILHMKFLGIDESHPDFGFGEYP